MDNNILYHYGTPKMRWGVRRYQNKDGTLTEAGKKRYARDVRENLAKKKDNRIDTSSPDPDRWVKEDLTRSKNTVDSMSRFVDDAKRVNSSITTKKERMDLSKMTNKELREKIDRETLERRYNDLFNDEQKVSKGKRFASKTLETTGATLAIGASALSIALAIKELKG